MAIHSSYKPKESIKEELANVIYNITPTATPFMSSVGRGKCSNTKFEWLEDELTAAAENAQLEGSPAVEPANPELKRYHNYTQISTKNVQVTGTANVVDRAGMNTQLAYELAKASKELKRDMEVGFCGRNGYQIGGTSGTAANDFRRSASMPTWTTKDTGTGAALKKGSYIQAAPSSAADYVHSGGTPGSFHFGKTSPGTAATANATAVFTEDNVKDAMLRAYDLGAEPTILMVSPGVKRTVSNFPGIAEHRINVAAPKESFILGAADVYLSDFGKLSVVPNRFMDENFAYFLDTSMVEVKYLRPFHTIDIARDGDRHKKLLVVEYGLCVKSPKGNVIVGGIKPAA